MLRHQPWYGSLCFNTNGTSLVKNSPNPKILQLIISFTQQNYLKIKSALFIKIDLILKFLIWFLSNTCFNVLFLLQQNGTSLFPVQILNSCNYSFQTKIWIFQIDIGHLFHIHWHLLVLFNIFRCIRYIWPCLMSTWRCLTSTWWSLTSTWGSLTSTENLHQPWRIIEVYSFQRGQPFSYNNII